MIKPAKRVALYVLSLAALSAGALSQGAFGQTVAVRNGSPLYTGFQIPKVNGTLSYSISALDRLTLGYDATDRTSNAPTIAGNLGLITSSVTHPARLTYSGGYLGSTSGQPSSFYSNLALGQTFNTKNWTLDLDDAVSFVPNTPAAGDIGLIGFGNIGVGTVPTPPIQGILSPYATRVSNTASGSVSRKLTGKTSIRGFGDYELQRFVGNSQGIQTDSYTGSGGIVHVIDSRTAIGGEYSWSSYSYVGIDGQFENQIVIFRVKRSVTRKFQLNIGAGPSRISASTLTGRGPSYTFAADISATYIGNEEHGAVYSARYTRVTNGGSGITFGATTDTFAGSASRRLTRSLNLAAMADYGHSAALQVISKTDFSTDTFLVGLQANRALTRTLSVYFSYNYQHQTSSGSTFGLAPINGQQQILSLGVTYSPSPVRLGR